MSETWQQRSNNADTTMSAWQGTSTVILERTMTSPNGWPVCATNAAQRVNGSLVASPTSASLGLHPMHAPDVLLFVALRHANASAHSPRPGTMLGRGSIAERIRPASTVTHTSIQRKPWHTTRTAIVRSVVVRKTALRVGSVCSMTRVSPVHSVPSADARMNARLRRNRIARTTRYVVPPVGPTMPAEANAWLDSSSPVRPIGISTIVSVRDAAMRAVARRTVIPLSEEDRRDTVRHFKLPYDPVPNTPHSTG